MKLRELLKESAEKNKEKEKEAEDLYVVGGSGSTKKSNYTGFEKPMTAKEKKEAKSRRDYNDSVVDKSKADEEKSKAKVDARIEKATKKIKTLQLKFDSALKMNNYKILVKMFEEIYDEFKDLSKEASRYDGRITTVKHYISEYGKNHFDVAFRKILKQIESKKVEQTDIDHIQLLTKSNLVGNNLLTPSVKASLNRLNKILK